jgi:hypothetical protein
VEATISHHVVFVCPAVATVEPLLRVFAASTTATHVVTVIFVAAAVGSLVVEPITIPTLSTGGHSEQMSIWVSAEWGVYASAIDREFIRASAAKSMSRGRMSVWSPADSGESMAGDGKKLN